MAKYFVSYTAPDPEEVDANGRFVTKRFKSREYEIDISAGSEAGEFQELLAELQDDPTVANIEIKLVKP